MRKIAYLGLLLLFPAGALQGKTPFDDAIIKPKTFMSSNTQEAKKDNFSREKLITKSKAKVKSWIEKVRRFFFDGASRVEQGIQMATERFHKDKAESGPTPVPIMEALRAKFPNSSLPPKLVGTTLDLAAMPVKDGNETTAQFAERRRKFCFDVMFKAQTMGFNSMRLGAYWSQIQPDPTKPPDFGYLDDLLEAAKANGINITLAVGAKAPGYPEFYIPDWAQTPATKGKGLNLAHDPVFRANAGKFVSMVARRYAADDTIGMWQVENEPLDRFNGSMNSIGPEMLQEEINILRKADGSQRPVLINVWSEGTSANKENMRKAFEMADAVALDVYFNAPSPAGRHFRTVHGPAYAAELARKTGKPLMIGELQADDWGDYKANAKDVQALSDQMERMGIKDLFFWRMDQNLSNNSRGDTSLDKVQEEIARSKLGSESKPSAP